jgi:hypothetical protein
MTPNQRQRGDAQIAEWVWHQNIVLCQMWHITPIHLLTSQKEAREPVRLAGKERTDAKERYELQTAFRPAPLIMARLPVRPGFFA